jgi:hypothetical protein
MNTDVNFRSKSHSIANSNSKSVITNQVIITPRNDTNGDLEIKYGEPDRKDKEIQTRDTEFVEKLRERDLKSAKLLENEFLSLIKPENIIETLTLIVDMIYSNPIKIESFVITEIASLQKLIQLLTNADDVIIETSIDADVGCCGNSAINYIKIVKSIGVRHEDVTREFKYDYQEACKFLKDRHISTKFVFSV